MNLLKRLGLGRSFDGLSLLRPRPSNGLRSVNPVPASSSAGKDASRWVMLNSLVRQMDDSVAADARTVAEARTATRSHLRVALGHSPPPASSFLYYDVVDCGPGYKACTYDPTIITSNGDSVLFVLKHTVAGSNYFVYTAGAAVGRPPSLSLVPARIIRLGAWQRSKASLTPENTGILRCGDEEVLVAQLDYSSDDQGPMNKANLAVFRLGDREWEFKTAVPIVAEPGGKATIPWRGSENDKVVGVRDRFMCWVHYRNGVLVCDMAEEHLQLQYVPMPVVPPSWKDDYEDGNRPPIEDSRNLFGTDDGVLRFVSIDLRCCCGGFGMSSCEHTRSAFMLTTWSLSLQTDRPMTWVKDTVLHCEELWALHGYEGLPRVHPECPILSLQNSDVVCFRVSEDDFTWMVEVDTRSKTLLSVVCCTTDAQKRYPHFPVKVDYVLNGEYLVA
ncbi:unnamed protein product [Urochloa decumbens]|uniref:DUF1618 domain-containing protein n=1 Tax=Urochloa decumbens TaxID=240449 RepID=A0ABC9AVS4_9POAL